MVGDETTVPVKERTRWTKNFCVVVGVTLKMSEERWVEQQKPGKEGKVKMKEKKDHEK